MPVTFFFTWNSFKVQWSKWSENTQNNNKLNTARNQWEILLSKLFPNGPSQWTKEETVHCLNNTSKDFIHLLRTKTWTVLNTGLSHPPWLPSSGSHSPILYRDMARERKGINNTFIYVNILDIRGRPESSQLQWESRAAVMMSCMIMKRWKQGMTLRGNKQNTMLYTYTVKLLKFYPYTICIKTLHYSII